MPLTLEDYYAGVRSWDAAFITTSPFYRPDLDRDDAVRYVRGTRIPVLRPSVSVTGCYVVVYIHPATRQIANTLIRHDGWSIQTLSEDGVTVRQTFPNLFVVLDHITGSRPRSGAPVIAGAGAGATVAAPIVEDPVPPMSCAAAAARSAGATAVEVSEDPSGEP
jgi:hypothetical protein